MWDDVGKLQTFVSYEAVSCRTIGILSSGRFSHGESGASYLVNAAMNVANAIKITQQAPMKASFAGTQPQP